MKLCGESNRRTEDVFSLQFHGLSLSHFETVITADPLVCLEIKLKISSLLRLSFSKRMTSTVHEFCAKYSPRMFTIASGAKDLIFALPLQLAI